MKQARREKPLRSLQHRDCSYKAVSLSAGRLAPQHCRRINIKNRWEKKGNRGLAVFSYSIPSQLIISDTLANLGHRESIKIMVLKTHENRRKSTKIAPYIMQDSINKIGVHPYFYPLNGLNGYSFGKYAEISQVGHKISFGVHF